MNPEPFNPAPVKSSRFTKRLIAYSLTTVLFLSLALYFALRIHHDVTPASVSVAPATQSVIPEIAKTWPTANLPPVAAVSTPAAVNPPLPAPKDESVAALIAGLTPDLDYQHRLAAIRSLDTNLSATDVACLMAYLADPATAKEGNLWDLALKNDTLAVLLRQEHLPENLGAMLVNIVSNKTQDLTWRDYALQVFPTYAERTTDRADSESQALRTVINAALTERGTVLPGTALIAMNRLSGTGGLYESNTVATEARKILDQSAAGDPARITAIQILAKTDATNALALARSMAHNEANPVLERMSAMAALGQVGDADDLKWLKEMATRAGQDKRLQTAANYNQNQLAQRVNL